MKKIYITLLAALLLVSCDDFLDQNPEHEISASEYFTSESDLEAYTNKFLNDRLTITNYTFGDQYADYIATRNSTNFLIGDNWTANEQGNWGSGDSGKWAQLRAANYLLDQLPRVKGIVSDAIYNHYEGVGRFWRAWFYYDMVREFGDVPWYDYEINPDDEEALYKGRDSREFVMDKVLEDLSFAAENCLSESKFVSSSTRISKWVALVFKSRVCLFEGTYRKYHTELGLTSSSEKFLNEAVKAAEELMEKGPYRLVDSPSARETQYFDLFSSTELNKTEVILGIQYTKDIRMHDTTWKMFSGTYGANWSFAKQFVNQYLMLDGSRYTDKADYNKNTFAKEFENRDYRMKQTMISPEYQRKSAGGVMYNYAPNFAVTLTGYQAIKWSQDDDTQIGLTTSVNSIPVFRYAEVLLNYAEAKAELGQMDDAVWNKSIKLLRERAGVNGKAPDSADPYLIEYYRNQTNDKWILEVRRERMIELAFEETRPDDLMRWKLGELFAVNWQGVYIPAKDKLIDLNGDGINDLYVADKGNLPASGQRDKNAYYLELGTTVRLTSDNLLEFGWAQNRKWSDRMYLRPIPTRAIQINPNLLPQNPGWD